MSPASRQPPEALQALVDRYDTGILHVPRGGARVRLSVQGTGDWDVRLSPRGARLAAPAGEADALLAADLATWRRMAEDLRSGMEAYRRGALRVRRNLHVGVGFLAATGGPEGPGRLRFRRVETRREGISILEAGTGPPLLMLHGLGGTKVSFLPTVADLADSFRLIAVDMPGFGDSDKPVGSYDARFLAERVLALLDALDLDRTHLLGHSLGGRVALEVAFEEPSRIDGLILMTPSLAWLRTRRWAPLLRLVRPELGLIQPAPRAITETIVRRIVPQSSGDGWAAAGVDEFLRGFLTPRGRAAFYSAARSIYLEHPDRFWERLRALEPRSLFIWGRRDPLVPVGFMQHVERALSSASHVELDCGHIPQLERPREAHGAIERFLSDSAGGGRRRAAAS